MSEPGPSFTSDEAHDLMAQTFPDTFSPVARIVSPENRQPNFNSPVMSPNYNSPMMQPAANQEVPAQQDNYRPANVPFPLSPAQDVMQQQQQAAYPYSLSPQRDLMQQQVAENNYRNPLSPNADDAEELNRAMNDLNIARNMDFKFPPEHKSRGSRRSSDSTSRQSSHSSRQSSHSSRQSSQSSRQSNRALRRREPVQAVVQPERKATDPKQKFSKLGNTKACYRCRAKKLKCNCRARGRVIEPCQRCIDKNKPCHRFPYETEIRGVSALQRIKASKDPNSAEYKELDEQLHRMVRDHFAMLRLNGHHVL